MTSELGSAPHTDAGLSGLADEANALVGTWIESVAEARAAGVSTASPTAALLNEAEGFDFGRDFVDLVASPDDAFVAAEGLRQVSREVPETLPVPLRLALRAGGLVSLGLPWAIVPLAKRRLRRLISPLVVTAEPRGLSARRELTRDPIARVLAETLELGCEPGASLLGDPVLGPDAAAARVAGMTRLLETPGLAALSIDPAGVLPELGDPRDAGWSQDSAASRAAELLAPLVARAAELGVAITLEAHSYRAALLVPELAERLLAATEADVDLGITVLAQLPESLGIMEGYAGLAHARAEEGRAPLHVRVTRGRIAAEEVAAAIISGLSVPNLDTREAVDAQLVRLLEFALAPERAAVLRPVLATREPHTIALALALAERRGTAQHLIIEQTRGSGAATLQALVDSGARPRLLAPVVPPGEFRGALALLRDLLELRAADGSAFERADAALFDPAAREAGNERAEAALAAAQEAPPETHRLQQRAREWDPSERDSALFYRPPADADRFDTGGLTAAVLGLTRGSTGAVRLEAAGPPIRVPAISVTGFANEPITDATRPENRAWMREVLAGAADSFDGEDRVAEAREAAGDIDALVGGAFASGHAWRQTPPHERATRLRRAALGTVAARDRLFQVLAATTGRPANELDAEVNDAVDAARYLGQLADGLGAVRGAEFQPDTLALVVTAPEAPLARAAEAVAALLAAGSAVVLVAHPAVARASAVLLEEWEATGLPEGLVRLAVAEAADGAHSDLAAALAADERFDRALFFGTAADARALVRRRPSLRIAAQLAARGSILVTPSADFALAARDIAASAFAGAGRDPDAARLVILLGSVARSPRFAELLADAVRAIEVGDTAHPGDVDPLTFRMGPMPAEPTNSEWAALTALDPGEKWLVQPKPLDESGRLWSPGVRTGTQKSSVFVRDYPGVPVIAVLTAHTLGEAIALQNAHGTGAVAGLHSTDPDEIGAWVDQVEAATLAVGRPTTGLRVERQPSGGWNEAGMGAQPLAGGPSRLIPLGSWTAREGTQSSTLHLRGLDPEVQLLIEAAQASLDYDAFDRVRRAALSDALTWRTSLGLVTDRVGLGVEGNLLRYWPVASHIRIAEGAELASLVRVLAAAFIVGAPFTLSTGDPLPREIAEVLATQGIEVSLERDADWLERLAASGAPGPGVPALRIRLIGGNPVQVAEWLGGLERTAVWAEPVTMAGPVELLSFLREQSISISAHQRGIGTGITLALFPAGAVAGAPR
ncbi:MULTISPECIES: proline dehydrogenase family protein [unclassified Leucobacter]|uniref:proline dehydrogenase family protein n=1 Tax=unclassified Leucobacter TaxID=2621730 RepID=UPI00203AA6FF|nr:MULTISPECIES: proline dehydrogenase family protein [unclassified Leucobacter]